MLDLTFTRNLAATAIILTLTSVSLAEVYRNPETSAKQQTVSRLQGAMKMGVVIKAQQLRYR